jgi:P27 family predicted phage terminase small subunit
MRRTITAGLTAAMAGFYRRVNRDYALSDHHRLVLLTACQAHDRMTQARALIDREGLTTPTARGGSRVHPAVTVERDSRVAFVRCLRELGLSDDPAEAPRPPRPRGRYQGRD